MNLPVRKSAEIHAIGLHDASRKSPLEFAHVRASSAYGCLHWNHECATCSAPFPLGPFHSPLGNLFNTQPIVLVSWREWRIASFVCSLYSTRCQTFAILLPSIRRRTGLLYIVFAITLSKTEPQQTRKDVRPASIHPKPLE
jgi:hypothetical protein